MKIKSLLSFFVPAAMLSLGVASCSDYDNGYDEAAIKFTEDFKKTFGDIDPNQDWNLAERGTVTVSTMKESEVKIYALIGDEYCIVGDYEGVKGTQMLGFDMVEGTKSIMVTDGVTAVKTVPGDVVTFGDTRTVLSNTAGLEVTKLASAVTIGEETYPAYKTVTGVEFEGLIGKNGKVPQAQYNIDNVSCDFSFVSTGSFIIYPIYWYTISQNTLGIYYTDASGYYHEVDIYKSRDSQADEIWYASDNTIIDNNEGWSFNHDSKNSVTPKNFGTQTTERNDQKDPSGIVAPFMEFWRGNTDVGIDHIKCSKEFTVSPNEECLVEVAARLRNQKNGNSDDMGTATFTANGNSVVLTDPNNCTRGSYTYDGVTHGNLYSNMNGTGKIWVKCKADNEGKIKVEWDVNTQNAANPANWFSFKDVKITRFDKSVNSMTAAGAGVENFVDNPDHNVVVSMVKGQGIRVDLKEDTKFGMYLKKQQDNETFTFYSESSKNALDSRLTNKISRYGFTCPLNYASTFYVGDQMYLGFEDWPSDYAGGGDFDLNDMIFAFDGCKPTIINEDPEPSSWLLACEDLGGTFDIDYNDVVFKVTHISGQEKATLTPLAAGGTLASYIYFEDPNGSNDHVFNEIHQLLGAEPQTSGDYTIINARHSRTEATADPIEFAVDKDWTLSFYSTDSYSLNRQYESGNVNMGGLEIRTLPKGTEAPSTIPNINSGIFSGASRIQPPGDTGVAPYILCIPASYTRLNMSGYTPQNGKKTEYEWAWPVEFCTITGPYPDFANWVSDHTVYGDWYKNKSTNGATVEDKYVVSDINGGNNVATLSVNQTVLYAYVGEHPDLIGNINTSSNETVKFSFEWEWLVELSDEEAQSTWKPDREGDLTFTATQGGNSVTFTLRTVKKAPEFGTEIQGVLTSGDDRWGKPDFGYAAGNRTINLDAGKQLFVNCVAKYNSKNLNEGEYTLTSFDAGTTGATHTDHWNSTQSNFMVYTHNAGTITMTFHYSGNDKYEAKDITITVNVTGGNANTNWLSNDRTSKYTLKITDNQNGTFNVEYDNQTLMSNVKKIRCSWDELNGNTEHNILVTNDGTKSVDVTGTSGFVELNLSEWKPNYNPFSIRFDTQHGSYLFKLKVEKIE